MFNFLKAIGRIFTSIFRLGRGRADRAARKLNKNPDALRAMGSEAKEGIARDARTLFENITSRQKHYEGNKTKLEGVKEQIKRLTHSKKSIKIKLMTIAKRHNNDKAAMMKDPEFIALRKATTQIDSRLSTATTQAESLKQLIITADKGITVDLERLDKMKMKLGDVDSKTEEAISNIINNKMMREMDEISAKCSGDTSSSVLSQLDDILDESRAESTVHKRVSEGSVEHTLAELEAIGADQAASDDLFAMIGLGDDEEADTEEEPVEDVGDGETAELV